MTASSSSATLPSALSLLPALDEWLAGRTPALFLDLDGTLAPIAATPELAHMPPPTRRLLASLASRYLVCVISGRSLPDLQEKVGLPTLYYGADHGHHIVGPPGSGIDMVVGSEVRPDIQRAGELLRASLEGVEGVIVEVKDLSLSVHYRLTPQHERIAVAEKAKEVADLFPTLDLKRGKLVHELRPREGWDKGRAMLWLLERKGLPLGRVCPICLGDDATDEDMFRAVGRNGISIVVGRSDRPTLARYSLDDVEQAAHFLSLLDQALPARFDRAMIE